MKGRLLVPLLEKEAYAGELRNLLVHSKLLGFIKAAVKKATHSGGMSTRLKCWDQNLKRSAGKDFGGENCSKTMSADGSTSSTNPNCIS